MKNNFESIYRQYEEKYDLSELDSPNDLANLTALINNQLIIEQLQAQAKQLAEIDIVTNVGNISEINDTSSQLIERNLQLERALALDRKTRKQEKSQSVAEYIKSLKIIAKEYVDQQIQKIQCPKCNIMVIRIAAVYKHMPFVLKVKCPQCNKAITIKQSEQHPLFDIVRSDRAWRDQYPIEIELPSSRKKALTTTEDVFIEGDDILEDDTEAYTGVTEKLDGTQT